MKMNSKSLNRRLLNLARPEIKLLSIGFIFLVISSAANLVYPQMIRSILDQAISTKSLSAVNQAALIIWIAFMAQGISSALRYYYFTLSGEKIVNRLRANLYSHLLNQEITFFDKNRTGDLMSRLSTDTAILQNAVSVNISMGIRNLAGAIGGLALMVYTSPKLALSILLVIPPVGIGVLFFGKRIREFSKKSQEAVGECSTVSEETLSGIRTVRSFSNEDFEQKRYFFSLNKTLEFAKSRILLITHFMNMSFIFGFSAISLVIWYGGQQVVTNQMSIGELTQFLIYLFILSFSVGALGGLWGDLMAASGAATRVFDIFDHQPIVQLNEGNKLSVVQGQINFDQVDFSYPTRPDVNVLKNISFTLKPGMTMALVGASGSGKSTIASLISRLYDVQSGAIYLDQVDIKTLNSTWLREQIGVVSQEPILISTTIEENILYGKQNSTFDEVKAAAHQANAFQFIEKFSENYKTLVGERGIQLSGGQKQRIAIARAILKNPKILILDEATSALDTESEALVQTALHNLMKGRTTLVIAHRLATIKNADLILVMHQGEIVETGTHEELLLKENGYYKKLIEKQV